MTVTDSSPTIAPIAGQENREGDTITLQVQSTDPQGVPLTYMLFSAPAGLSIDQNGRISGTIQPGAATGGKPGRESSRQLTTPGPTLSPFPLRPFPLRYVPG
jgi:hypothetical protein